MEFFSSMEPYLQGFWFIAVPVSIIFVIQTVMTFVGANASDGLALFLAQLGEFPIRLQLDRYFFL